MTRTTGREPHPDEQVEARLYPYWQRNLRVLPPANALTSMGFAVSVPFLPVMLGSLGVHDHLETWVGNAMLMFYVISFACGPVWGSIADHFGRKIMVLRAMFGMGILMALVPFAPSPTWFVLLFAVVGFFNGGAMSAQALIVANTPPRRIGGALTRLQSTMLLGSTMGPVLATSLMAAFSRPHWLFWVSGGLLITGGMLVLVFAREVKQLASGPWRLDWLGSLRELVAVPRIGKLYVLNFMYAMLASGNTTVLSVYVLQLLGPEASGGGAGAFWIGAVAMGLAVSSVISLALWGRLLDRIDPVRVLVFTTGAAALTQLPLIVLQTPLQLVMSRIAFGLCASLMQPAIVRLMKSYAPPGMDARAISYSTSFQFIAIGTAPFLAGLIGPVFGLRSYFALTAALILAAFVMWLRVARRR